MFSFPQILPKCSSPYSLNFTIFPLSLKKTYKNRNKNKQGPTKISLSLFSVDQLFLGVVCPLKYG